MKPDAILLLAVLVGSPQISPRVTPLGTQRPKPEDPDKKNTSKVHEKPEQIVERSVNAHGGRRAWTSVQDSIFEGKLSYFNGKNSKNTIEVTVIRKGDLRVQRVLKQDGGELHQGSDGTSTWESLNGMTVLAPGGLAGNFIESQTVRGPANLFDFQAKGLVVRDAGKKGNARVVELEEAQPGKPPRKTWYFIDETTARVTRIEFATGEAKDLLGKTIPSTESYAFADFRTVQGVLTPFRIERYVDALKIEETQFTSVRYNASVKDEAFKP